MATTLMPGAKEPVFRLFVALPVPDAVKEAIHTAQKELQRLLPAARVSWLRPRQWHLTLKFLGNLEARRLPELTEIVRTGCEKFAPLNLRAEQIGCFPSVRHPRVIWAGVQDERNQLPRLVQAIEVATAEFSAPSKEDRYTGHITIGRTKEFRRPEIETLMAFANQMAGHVFGTWTANTIEIMRSELSFGGANHTCLDRLRLG